MEFINVFSFILTFCLLSPGSAKVDNGWGRN